MQDYATIIYTVSWDEGKKESIHVLSRHTAARD